VTSRKSPTRTRARTESADNERFLEDEESSRLHCWSETYTSWIPDRPRKPLNDIDADTDAPQKPPVSTSRIRTNLERSPHHALSCRYRDRAKGSRNHKADGWLQVEYLPVTPVQHAFASARELPRTARVPYPLPRDSSPPPGNRTVYLNGPASVVPAGRWRARRTRTPSTISPSQLAASSGEPLRIRASRLLLCIGPRQLGRPSLPPPFAGPTINTPYCGRPQGPRRKSKSPESHWRPLMPHPVLQEPLRTCSLPLTTP
jgi:hypothetical protein